MERMALLSWEAGTEASLEGSGWEEDGRLRHKGGVTPVAPGESLGDKTCII